MAKLGCHLHLPLMNSRRHRCCAGIVVTTPV